MKRALASSIDVLLLYSLVIGYVSVFSYISLMKYFTFGATVLDLGLWNQLYWLTLHGGPSAWYKYAGYILHWQYPYQQLSFIMYLPFYAIYPHPETLLVSQSVVTSLAAIPLYYLARSYSHGRMFSLVMVFAFLVYFPVQQANLFDFHVMTAFPLFFFAAVHSWRVNRKVPLIAFTLAAALTNPLNLMIMILFTFYIVSHGQYNSALEVFWLQNIIKCLRGRRTELCLSLLLVGILAAQTLTNYIAPYAVVAGVNTSNIVQSLFVSPDAKINYFLLLLAPLAFLPVFDPLACVLSLPSLAFVFLSQNSSHWQVFGLHYPLVIVPVLCLGTIRSARRLSFSDWSSKRFAKFVSALLLSFTVIFASVYSPIGPLNSYIQGGYGAGNADLSSILSVNEVDVFLHKAISLVPPDASVLTQNDIPQLTGRYHFQVATAWLGATEFNLTAPLSYDYILANSGTFWFGPIRPYVDGGLRNGTFGVLAEGYGIILLQKGYNGEPLLYVPTKEVWAANKLLLYSGYRIDNHIVHYPNVSGIDFSFWYGPYVSLSRGTYEVNYTLIVQDIVPKNASIITLDVVSEGGNITYSSRMLKLGDFDQPSEWTTFTLEFSLTGYTELLEFRGMHVTNATMITLASISVLKISPQPRP